ncbi:MAG: hypothetical protein ACR2MW_10225 [Chthoniobacterales bacterium]
MRFSLTILLLAATVGTALAGPIDFTPTEGSRTLEGVVFKQLRFHQDGHVISYEPPAGWRCTGDAGGMRLAPPEISQAQVTVQQATLPAPQVFDEATTRQLQQQVLGSAPSGALNVALLAEEQSPVRIHLQETYGVTIGYNFLGQEYAANVLFANLGETQVRFRTVARKEDFEKVWRGFRGSLFTLAWE